MIHHYTFTLFTSAGSHTVRYPVEPVSPYQSVPGFYNIAHRGASYYAPENTMPAFKKAVEMKADMIELDVTLSRDKVPVVIHDARLDRTTNGEGIVKNLFERELRELDAGSWFNEEFKSACIPTLENVLSWAKGKIALNIEIKKEAFLKDEKNGIAEQTAELLAGSGMTGHVVISSFSKDALKRFKTLSDDLSTAFLISPYALGTSQVYRQMQKMGANGLNMKAHQMSKKLMDLAKKNNVPVWVYTVDDEEDMAEAIRKGASGIFTNRPDLLRSVAISELRRDQD